MKDLFDYLDWRGDLTFGNVPLCPIDALVFSVLSYVRLEGFIPTDVYATPVRLADAANAYLKSVEGEEPTQHRLFLQRVAASARFGQLRVFGAQHELDAQMGIQFAAYSILLPGQNLFVAFEGTDDTLIGWLEDFRMSYECPVPAQLRAAAYLRSVAAVYPLRRIYTGGHSKGGNLAMYAAVHSGPAVRYRVRGVYNNDGPGFCDDTLSNPNYMEMRERIHTYLPESSIVAVLLEHDNNYKIIKSHAKGLAQHDPYTWAVQGADFLYAAERTAFGQRTEAIVDHFVDTLSPERKRVFGEALFKMLEATNQSTLSGITANKMQSLKGVLRSFGDMEPEMREVLLEAISALTSSRKSARRSAKKLPVSEELPQLPIGKTDIPS